MTPIIGITASSITSSVLGNFESIATAVVGSGGTGTITFDNIPGTYTHLQFRMLYANTVADGENDTLWRINDNTTANNYYNLHQLKGNGTSATAAGVNSLGAYIAVAPYASSTTAFSVAIVDILDYANTNKNKTFRSLTGGDTNGGGAVFLRSGLYINTGAITKIVITPFANNLAQYSHIALYGCK